MARYEHLPIYKQVMVAPGILPLATLVPPCNIGRGGAFRAGRRGIKNQKNQGVRLVDKNQGVRLADPQAINQASDQRV